MLRRQSATPAPVTGDSRVTLQLSMVPPTDVVSCNCSLWSQRFLNIFDRSHSVASSGLEHRNPPASASQLLGLKVTLPYCVLFKFSWLSLGWTGQCLCGWRHVPCSRALAALSQGQVWYPAPMWWLATVCYSSLRKCSILFWPPLALHVCVTQTHLQARHPHKEQ